MSDVRHREHDSSFAAAFPPFDALGEDDASARASDDWQPLAAVARRNDRVDTQEANMLREGAEEAARRILQDAQAEAELLLGRHNEELARARAAADAFAERTGQIAAELERARAELLERIELHTLALTAQMAGKVIKRAIAADNTIVVDVVRDTLSRVAHSHRIRVSVNPKDREAVSSQMQQLVGSLEAADGLEVIADPGVGEGGCVVRTEHGEIDARIETQLRALTSQFEELTGRVAGGR
jgi:flagellar assembly protein FliH